MATNPTTPSIPTMPASGQRSLAAIVFTDVVGFSAHMQANEELTLRLLQRDFDLIRSISAQHQGSVLKSTGDGLLLYFSSAVQAVACALALQRTFAEQARGRSFEETLEHRLGIHLGDVFVNEQDVMGDGVNIAARLQAEADPGGICISQTVYDVVRNKLALQVARLSPRELKNMSETVPIYKLLLAAQSPAPATPRSERPPTRMPFPAPKPKRRRRGVIVGAILVAVALLAGATWFVRHDRSSKEAKALVQHHEDFQALFTPEVRADAAMTPERVERTLTNWRIEFRDRRSRAFEAYNFGELLQNARDPQSPVAGQPEADVRLQTVQRVQALMAWLPIALQYYTREQPLVVRELTGTAPKETRVFGGADRRLYYIEGGAVRQRGWNDLRPTELGAMVSATMIDSPTLPPRDVALGALALADLYHLPELSQSLRHARPKRPTSP